MSRLTAESVRMAKANVRRWFIETSVGPAFLPGNGAAIQLAKDQALAVRSAAEEKIALSYAEIQARTVLHIFILVLVITGFSMLAGRLPEPAKAAVQWVSYGVYCLHGFIMLHDYWRWERGIFRLREAIGHSLSSRVPLPATLAGPVAMPEPNYRNWQTVAFLMAGLFLAYEMAAPLAKLSPWIPALLVAAMAGILFWFLGFALIQDIARLLPKDRSRR